MIGRDLIGPALQSTGAVEQPSRRPRVRDQDSRLLPDQALSPCDLRQAPAGFRDLLKDQTRARSGRGQAIPSLVDVTPRLSGVPGPTGP